MSGIPVSEHCLGIHCLQGLRASHLSLECQPACLQQSEKHKECSIQTFGKLNTKASWKSINLHYFCVPINNFF